MGVVDRFADLEKKLEAASARKSVTLAVAGVLAFLLPGLAAEKRAEAEVVTSKSSTPAAPSRARLDSEGGRMLKETQQLLDAGRLRQAERLLTRFLATRTKLFPDVFCLRGAVRVKLEDFAGAFADARAAMVHTIDSLLANGRMATRIVHGDTKLNNVLFDSDTGKPVCIVDLDTCMPAYSLYDFGDLVRFTAATSAEDETEMRPKPVPLEQSEVDSILHQMESVKPRLRVGFEKGQMVRITDGPFVDFMGTIDEVYPDRSKVKVLVSFFDRETPVELDFLQIEKT